MLNHYTQYFVDLESIDYDKIRDQIISFYKKGGSLPNPIHIKAKNKGKFTKSAKSQGESVQSYAHHVIDNPDATTLQKRRANFAIQAKKWHHK